MPEKQVLHQVGTAKVKVAVLQPQLFVGPGAFDDLKRRRFSFRKDAQPVHVHLDAAGGQVGVLALPLADGADRRDDVFAAAGDALPAHGGVALLIERELDKPRAVAQIDEQQAAEVAAALHPAHHANARADVAFRQDAAVVRPLERTESFSHI